MAVIPFPTSRFTKCDVSAIVELCYRLTSIDLAGGWARHTSDKGADILRILNTHDNGTQFSFDRTGNGRYRMSGPDGNVMAVADTVDEILAEIPKN